MIVKNRSLQLGVKGHLVIQIWKDIDLQKVIHEKIGKWNWNKLPDTQYMRYVNMQPYTGQRCKVTWTSNYPIYAIILWIRDLGLHVDIYWVQKKTPNMCVESLKSYIIYWVLTNNKQKSKMGQFYTQYMQHFIFWVQKFHPIYV